MKYQFLQNADIKDADILILPFGYEKTVSAKSGTSYAPEAVLKASEQIEYYDEYFEYSPMKHLFVSVLDKISGYKDFKSTIQNLKFLDDKLLITIGGEHSITPMLTDELLNRGSTVVFLDAHADLRVSYMGDEYSHATPAHHLLKQGHKLIMAGVRSMFEDEALRVKNDKNITFFSDIALRNKETKKRFLDTLEEIEGDVYLSIDMDVFDPACVPSVGTPQPGGIDWYDILDILNSLFSNKNITLKGVDIVELIPSSSMVSEVFAAKLIQKIISSWGICKGYRNFDKKGSQSYMEYE